MSQSNGAEASGEGKQNLEKEETEIKDPSSLTEILQNNNGLVIGGLNESLAAIDYIAAQMSELKKAGAEVLFIQTSHNTSELQQAVEAFNADPASAEHTHLPQLLEPDAPALYVAEASVMTVLNAAHANGIKVVSVGPKRPAIERPIVDGNLTASKQIEAYKLKAGEKFEVITGKMNTDVVNRNVGEDDALGIEKYVNAASVVFLPSMPIINGKNVTLRADPEHPDTYFAVGPSYRNSAISITPADFRNSVSIRA
jgi:hypothetical protein